MKTSCRLLVCLIAVFAFVALAGSVAAATGSISVAAGGSTPVSLGTLTKDDWLTVQWTSNVAVSATLSGPDGVVETFSAATSGGWDHPLITVPDTGTYTLTFENSGSVAASVTYTTTVTPWNPVDEATDFLTWLMIIAVIIIVVIIAIVVLVVVLGAKKKKAAAMGGAPLGIVMPTTPGICPVCGAQTDTNAPFCAKCGAKFR